MLRIVTKRRRVPGPRLLMSSLTAVILLLALTVAPNAAIINVPADFPTIQQAIDAAAPADHDTILVAPGNYLENLNIKGKLIFLTSHFLFDQDPSFIFTTIIDGSSPANPDTASVVRMTSTEDTSTTIQGFTITGGTGTTWTDPHGAGVYREGGGILTEGNSPTIQYNLIIYNDAVTVDAGLQSAGGGAIRSGDGSPRILNNIIMYNRARYGGGIVLNYAGGIIRNNIIAHNSGGEDFGGSGLWKLGAAPPCTAENNTIVHNTSALGGGGVYLWQSTMTFRNNIVFGNTAPSFPQIRTNGGTLTISYCDVQGGWPGTGNINANPDLRGNYYYTTETSPCSDAGDPSPLLEDPEDLLSPGTARWPSVGALRNDIGAYGGPAAFTFERTVIIPDIRFGWAPFDVEFRGYTTHPALAWDWNFGDGETGTGNNALHTYTLPGLHDITLTVDTGSGSLTITQPQLIAVLADSLAGSTISGPRDTILEVTVSARNNVPVEEIIIPFVSIGPLNAEFVDYTVEGCRTDYFEVKTLLHANPVGRQYTLKLRSSNLGSSPAMPPGDGPIVKLRFYIPADASSGSEDTISFDGYLTYAPRFTGWGIAYQPITTDGSIAFVCCLKRGNVDASANGSVNVGDLTYLVNFLFKSGFPPECPDEANVDSSANGTVNVSDLTYLVNYLFKSGPQPPACS